MKSLVGMIYIFILINTAAAYASWSNIVSQARRPHPIEIESEYSKQHLSTETLSLKNKGLTPRVQWIRNNPRQAIQLLLNFEIAFPGATYAFLGRDAVFIHDFMTIFYRSHGLNPPTQRLDASGATIDLATDQSLLQFLSSHGFDLEKVKSGEGYILVDGTSFKKNLNYLSQIRRLLQVSYQEASKQIPPHLLIPLLNAVNTKDPYINQNTLGEIKIDTYFQRESAHATQLGPKMIVTSPFPSLLTHGLQWHDSFGAMVKTDLTLNGTPGTLAPVSDREILIGEILQLFDLTQSESFKSLSQSMITEQQISLGDKARLKPIDLSKTQPILNEKEEKLYELARLKKDSQDLLRITEMTTNLLSRTDLDAWELVEILQPSKPYKKEMQSYFNFFERRWLENISRFQQLNPPLNLILTARRNVTTIEVNQALITAFVKKQTTLSDVISLLNPLVDNPVPSYREMLNNIWLSNESFMTKLNPTSDEIHQAQNQSGIPSLFAEVLKSRCQISITTPPLSEVNP